MNKNTEDLNQKITMVGLVCSSVVALIFFLWSGPLSNHWAILSSLLLALTVHLSIWFGTTKLKNYGKSFLIVFILLFATCYLPYAFAGVLALGLLLLVLFLRNLTKKCFDYLVLTVFFGVLFGLIIFGSTSVGMGDAFIGEKIRQLSFNPDDLFFAAMSTMARNYGRISTGLHGMPWVHYHFLSAQMYGMLSKLLFIEPFESFGYVNYIVFCPLLVSSCLALVEQTMGSVDRKWLLINLIVFGSAFTRTFGWTEHSHFISESYLMGCLLLANALCVLAPIVRSPVIAWEDFIFILIFLPLTSAGKISAGCMLTIGAVIAVTLKPLVSLQKRAIAISLVSLFGLIGYKLSRTVPMKGLEAVFHWKHYQDAIGPHWMPYFLLVMFPYLFLVAPGYYILHKSNKLTHEIKTWFLILAACSTVGFISLNLTIDSAGYYFSGLHAFIALPLLAIFMSRNPEPFRMITNLKNNAYEKRFVGFLALFLASAGIFYFLAIFPKDIGLISSIKKSVLKNISYKNKYSPLFAQIRNDPDSKLMVYVPKSEIDFWNNEDGTYAFIKDTQCISMPFYIPILTGKPAIFGLPEPAMQCYVFHRGYEAYSDDDYVASARSNYTHEQLCEEVLKRRFHGYYRVTTVAEKHLCEATL